MKINEQGYLIRNRTRKYKDGIPRDWWLIKSQNGRNAYVSFPRIYLNKEFIGKKVKFKIILEVIKT